MTGGAGYIGSHTCLALLEAGHRLIVVDNLANGSAVAIDRVADLTGGDIELVVADVTDVDTLASAFSGPVDAVIHFAGLKAVGESVGQPLRYYRNNVGGSLALIEVMEAHGVRTLVFSSSATVYGDPDELPMREDARLEPVNPYGRTKLIQEQIFGDLAAADPRWHIALLRYFNPVGAHGSGAIGEDPAGIPDNLMPFVMQVAVGRRPELEVFGDDYPTPDGTCLRDYIHVMDLAEGHLAALDALDSRPGCRPWNLGTGVASSVLDVVAAAERAIGRPVPKRVVGRRAGDAPAAWADPSRATEELGWTATRDLDAMCRDHWNWQQQNPGGYGEEGR